MTAGKPAAEHEGDVVTGDPDAAAKRRRGASAEFRAVAGVE